MSLVAHRNVTSAAIETFDASVAAFQRHAAIASDLRGGSWTLVAYGAAAWLDARSLNNDTFTHRVNLV